MSEQQVLPEWVKMLKHAADEATVMWEDYDWPKDELLVLPPFYVTRKFVAAASPDVILKLITSLAQSEAEREGLRQVVKEYRIRHKYCVPIGNDDDRCNACIKADALLEPAPVATGEGIDETNR